MADEAISLVNRWREQTNGGRIFDVSTGFRTAWPKLLKRANITKFRWLDLRHHFASRLVQLGVPLNTVRDLLGQLSGDVIAIRPLGACQRREAVAKLNEKPLHALTMRLQWNQGPRAHSYPIVPFLIEGLHHIPPEYIDDTFRHLRETQNAVAGVLQDGRAA
jgi:hypothetical protein